MNLIVALAALRPKKKKKKKAPVRMPHSDYLFLDSLIRLDAKRADLPAFPRIDAPIYATR